MILEKANRSIMFVGKLNTIQHKVLNCILHILRQRFREPNGLDLPIPDEIAIPFKLVSRDTDLTTSDHKKSFEKAIGKISSIQFTEINDERYRIVNVNEFAECVWNEKVIKLSPTRTFYNMCKDHFVDGGFVSLPVQEILPLTSVYSLKFFELLKQMVEVGNTDFTKTIVWIKDWLLVTDRYKLFSNFRKTILEASHLEIVSKTQLSFEYEIIRKGKEAHSIRFYNVHYKKEDKRIERTLKKIESEKNEKINESTAILELLKSISIIGEKAQNLVTTYPDLKFMRALIDDVKKWAKSPSGAVIKCAPEKWIEYQAGNYPSKPKITILTPSAPIPENEKMTDEEVEEWSKQMKNNLTHKRGS